METNRILVTHVVHTAIPGTMPMESMWFDSEKNAIEYYELIKQMAIDEQCNIAGSQDSQEMIVTEIHPKRYEVTWGDKGAGYAVWIEEAEPGTYFDETAI